MTDNRQPPSYDTVVGGTWQQGYAVPQNNTPYPPYLVQPTNGGFENDSSQQAFPPNINTRLTAEPPPSYNATVADVETKVDVTTPTVTAATSSSDETNCEFYYYFCFTKKINYLKNSFMNFFLFLFFCY